MYGLYIFDKVGVTSYNNIKINLLEDLPNYASFCEYLAKKISLKLYQS